MNPTDNTQAVTQKPDAITQRRKTYLWIEVGVVLIACLLPYIFNSEAEMYGLAGRRSSVPFVYSVLHLLIGHVVQIAVVLFIIWRSTDPFSRFGFKPFKVGRDIFGGLVICALLRVSDRLLWWGFRTFLSRYAYSELLHSGTSIGFPTPSGAPDFVLLSVMCIASGFAQELVMRSYLIVRFEELFESTAVALLLSTVLFTSYHGYQGMAGVISVALFGLIEAVLFCFFRRLAPIAVAHAVNNFIAFAKLSLP